jgi:hypothetical protein
MNLYIVNLNKETNIYMKREDIPFDISEDNLDKLKQNKYVSFFSEDGEIHLIYSENNQEIYEELYAHPEPLDKDGFISISHYNKNKRLHTHSENIPSFINTRMNKIDYHKNGKLSKLKPKEILEDNYGEYTLLKNLPKDLQEVRCYKDGFRQQFFINEDIKWIFNKKLHRKEGPALIKYYSDGSIQSESYYINGEYHRENKPAYIKYHYDGSLKYELYYLKGKQHRDNYPSFIQYYNNGFVRKEYYCLNGEFHREEGPAKIYYNEYGSIQSEKYYINGVQQN